MSPNTNAVPAAPFISSSQLFTNIPQGVLDHIEEGVYEVTKPNILVCIDGRTPREHTYWGGTTPGGTLWTLASMFSGIEHEFSEGGKLKIEDILNRSARTYRKTIFDLLQFQIDGGQNVYYHTDEHACECWEIGCGHLKLALNDTDETNPYKLSEESRKFIEDIRKRFYRNKSVVVLSGEHEEKYVLHVEGTSHSVVPNSIHQAFVSTPDLVKRQKISLARRVFPLLNEDRRNNSAPLELADAMIQSYMRHTQNTVNSTAKWLPHYSVKFTRDGKISNVQEVKRAA